MSERSAALAEAIATGLEHIATGLRQWAKAQRTMTEVTPSRVSSPSPTAAPDVSGDRLLRVKEAAEVLGVGRSTVYKYVNEGLLARHERTGRIARSELDRFIRSGRAQ